MELIVTNWLDGFLKKIRQHVEDLFLEKKMEPSHLAALDRIRL